MLKRIAGALALTVIAFQAMTGVAAAATNGLGNPWTGSATTDCDLADGVVTSDGFAVIYLTGSGSGTTLNCFVDGFSTSDDESIPLSLVEEPLLVKSEGELLIVLLNVQTGLPADYKGLTVWTYAANEVTFWAGCMCAPNSKERGADITITDTTFTGQGLDGVIKFAEFAWFDGGSNDDIVDASGVSNSFVALFGDYGNDSLTGGSDDDWISGDEGNDTLAGGDGDDHIFGGGAPLVDTLNGGAGEDELYAFSPGPTSLPAGLDPAVPEEVSGLGLGGAGTCSIGAMGGCGGWSGPIIANGGDGDDQIWGAEYKDTLHGDAGDDEIYGADAADKLYGDAGDDELIGSTGADKLYGGEGDDVLDCAAESSSEESDQCWGQAGDDELVLGNDTMFMGMGGPAVVGLDTGAPGDGENAVDVSVDHGNTEVALSYADRTSGVDLLIGPMTGPSDEVCDASDFGDDTVTGACDVIVSITGSNFADVIDAGDADNGTGLVAISGLKGADRLVGGENAETIVGGPGADRIAGNDGGDELSGGKGEDHILGGEGGDTIYAGSEDDKVFAGAGSDDVYGSTGDDLIYGEDDSDDLVGGVGDDRLSGGEGDDDLVGAAGDDQLHGDAGDDDLVGNLGDDRAWGDEGSEDYCNAEVTGTCEWVRVVTATGGYWAKV